MKKNTILLLIFFGISLSMFSQSSFEDLKKEIVQNTDQKMTITFYRMIVTEEASTQYKFYAEAPLNGLISRDYFVSIFYEIYQTLIDEIGAAQITPLDEIIGEEDVEIKIYMGSSGLQIVAKTGSETSKETYLWKDLFENN